MKLTSVDASSNPEKFIYNIASSKTKPNLKVGDYVRNSD